MSVNNVSYRDAMATRTIGSFTGHTAAGWVHVQLRKVTKGWLYWNSDSLLFMLDVEPISPSDFLVLPFEEIGMPRSKYLLWNGELDFLNGQFVFHGQRKQIRQLQGELDRFHTL